MSVAGDRPQDVERPHRRRPGELEPDVDDQLRAYRRALRLELADLLAEIRPPAPSSGQLALDGTLAAPTRPALEQRRQLWDLAIRVARELGQAPGVTAETAPAPSRPKRGAPRLTARARRALEPG